MEMTIQTAMNIILPDRAGSVNDIAGHGSLRNTYWAAGLIVAFFLVGVGFMLTRIKNYTLINGALRAELDSEKICLAQLTEEKEFLVREIHHRVKNNLQIMMSLLNMQSSYLKNHEAITGIRNSNHRLFAISLVHQKLYQADNLSCVDIPLYLQELGQYLQYELGGTERVAVQINADPVCLDIATAIPLGLIVHEALSNALKHAFQNGRKGSVSIYLHSEDDLQYLLQISDDGVGLPEGSDIGENHSLGQSLMTGLSGQLRGKLSIQNHNGVTVSLVFPKHIGIQTDLLPNLKDTFIL